MVVSPPDDHRYTLPAPLTQLVGREREIAAIRDLLLSADVPLLTLTGAGGAGKTRLALQVAGNLADAFPGGVVFVPLAAIGDADFVAETIAQELGLGEASDRQRRGLQAEALYDAQTLLVLDNLEQVLPAAPFIADLLAEFPAIKLLITSRVPLRIAGEQEFPVPPLALPDAQRRPALDELAATEAIALFVQRARAVRPDFTLTEANADTIVTICRRLDGLPLAIELAAARTKVLSPQALLARLTNRLQVLTGGARDQPLRLQTMRDAIAWSYDLLDVDEQALFRRLAVFAGGFSLGAAEVVAEGGRREADKTVGSQAFRHPPSASVLDGLASLVDKSLLRPVDEVDGEPRFVMLETVREFGLEQMAASGEEEITRRTHAAHVLWLAERAHPGRSGGVQEARWLEVLEAEHDNFRSALTWSIGAADVEVAIRLAAALGWFWYLRGHLTEGRRWLDQALALARPNRADAHVARALRAAGKLAWEQADYARSADLLTEGAILARDLGDEGGAARALLNLGIVAERQGDDRRATALYEEALALFRRLDERPGIANALLALAEMAFHQNDLDRSTLLSDEALSLSRDIGDPMLEALSWETIGQLALARRDASEAWRCYKEGLRLFVRLRNGWGIADALGGMAGVAAETGETDLAARWLGTAQELCNTLGMSGVSHQTQFDRSLAAARTALDATAFEAAAAEGGQITAEEAAAEALAWTPTRGHPTVRATHSGDTATFGLTEREREVLRLLAGGLSNNEIADLLSISPRTASTHVGRILEKLGVNSRAAAVAIAFQHGLA